MKPVCIISFDIDYFLLYGFSINPIVKSLEKLER